MAEPQPASAAAHGSPVVVLGAGMVGIACALALRQRGLAVTVLDPLGPGAATSYGNAGVITRSSLQPFNHPGLWRQLPGLLRGRSPGFRHDPRWLLANAGWAAAFLASARASSFEATTQALDALIRHSGALHRRWMDEAGVAHRRRDDGWLLLYRSQAAFDAAAASRALLARFGVATEVLDADGLRGLEPALRPLFPRALWVRDASAVDDPGAVVRAYAQWFLRLGGQLLQEPALALQAEGGGWRIERPAGPALRAGRVVLALGPWSQAFLREHLGLRLPMGFERGYHRHFSPPAGRTLGRPVHDTAGGYVLAPMAQGLRLTSGVELAAREAPARTAQIDAAEQAAREVLDLGPRQPGPDWLGSRPTLPDSRPVLGECPGRPGLWLALGHQHIGFSTGPASGDLLARLMLGEPPAIDPEPFRPQRWLR